jgi:hypothetical protein
VDDAETEVRTSNLILMEYIVRTTSFGGRDLSEMKAAIPNLKVVTDYNHDAMGNFLNAMSMTSEPAIQLEDDAILCNNFCERIEEAVSHYPDLIINFFSLRKGDYDVRKPYMQTGSKFIGNVCVYIPAGFGPAIAEYYKVWERKKTDPTGYDLLMADWMKERKLKYVQWFPHLVNHAVCKSLIDPRRSSKRTDNFFMK